MIQLWSLQQMYYTAVCFPVCHNCQLSEGTFLHTICQCSKVRPLWSQVTEFIADKFGLPNVCNPLLCLLGVIEDEEMDAVTKSFLKLLFFYGSKLIARRWIYVEQLTVGMWLKWVNTDIPLY